jgi:hypothetical protein
MGNIFNTLKYFQSKGVDLTHVTVRDGNKHPDMDHTLHQFSSFSDSGTSNCFSSSDDHDKTPSKVLLSPAYEIFGYEFKASDIMEWGHKKETLNNHTKMLNLLTARLKLAENHLQNILPSSALDPLLVTPYTMQPVAVPAVFSEEKTFRKFSVIFGLFGSAAKKGRIFCGYSFRIFFIFSI